MRRRSLFCSLMVELIKLTSDRCTWLIYLQFFSKVLMAIYVNPFKTGLCLQGPYQTNWHLIFLLFHSILFLLYYWFSLTCLLYCIYIYFYLIFFFPSCNIATRFLPCLQERLQSLWALFYLWCKIRYAWIVCEVVNSVLVFILVWSCSGML